MEIIETPIAAYKILAGKQFLTITEGKTLTIETSPSGVDVLSKTVPAGKSWKVFVSVHIEESNI